MKAARLTAALAFGLASSRGAWGTLRAVDDVRYLERLREAIERSDVIVEGRLEVTLNSRIEPLVVPDPEIADQIGRRLASHKLDSIWNRRSGGELAGEVSVAGVLKGEAREAERIRVRFQRGTFFVPPGGILHMMSGGDILLRSDIARGAFIWLLTEKGEYRPADKEPGFYVLPATSRKIVEMLLARAGEDTLREEANRLISSKEAEGVVAGIRVLACLKRPGDLEMLAPLLFAADYEVRNAARYACARMPEQATPEFFLGLADGIRGATHPDSALQAARLVARLTGKETGISRRMTSEQKASALGELADWLKANATALTDSGDSH